MTTKILNLILVASLIIGGYAAVGIWHTTLYDKIIIVVGTWEGI